MLLVVWYGCLPITLAGWSHLSLLIYTSHPHILPTTPMYTSPSSLCTHLPVRLLKPPVSTAEQMWTVQSRQNMTNHIHGVISVGLKCGVFVTMPQNVPREQIRRGQSAKWSGVDKSPIGNLVRLLVHLEIHFAVGIIRITYLYIRFRSVQSDHYALTIKLMV